MRHVTDAERRARLARRHALAPRPPRRRPGGRDPRDDGAARDRAGHRLPLAAGPRRRRSPWPTSTGRCTTTARWSSSSRCGARCSSSRATCCRPRGGAPPRGWPRQLRDPAGQGGRGRPGSPTTAPPGSTPRAAAVLAPPRRRRRASTAQDAARARCPSSTAGSTSRPARPTAPTSRSRRGCSPSSASRPSWSCAARNAGHWRISRPQWTLMTDWLGERPAPLRGRRGVRRAGRAAGSRPSGRAPRPTCGGGWAPPRAPCARALADVGAVEVALDGGGTGWVLPDDVDPVPTVEPWAALLPVLDPTVMGWKERDFYLGAARAAPLFDTQRQRRHHRLVGRPGRRLLGAGRRRAW